MSEQKDVLTIFPLVTKALAEFLGSALRAAGGSDYWTELVLPVLTPQQLDHVKRRRIDRLTGMDLAALLRITDQQYAAISRGRHWPREVRTYLRETQLIRNRWAHHGADGPTSDDVYRDLDTLERLIRGLGADESLADEINRRKRASLVGGGSDRAQLVKNDSEAQAPIPRVPAQASASAVRSQAISSTGRPVFHLKLGKTYYEKGYFNISIDFSRFVTEEEGAFEVQLGDSGAVLQGRMSRKANPATHAPRIFGGAALRDWLQANFQFNDHVAVEILSPTVLKMHGPG